MPIPEEVVIKSVQNSLNKRESAHELIYFMHFFITFITPSMKETVTYL